MSTEKILKSTTLFSKLTDEQFSKLVSQIEEINVDAGVTFIQEGDKADALYVVKKGVLQVFTLGSKEEIIVFARLEDGAFFGEQALLSSTGIRTASVRTVTESKLLKIDHKIFQQLIETDEILKRELKEEGFKYLLNKLKALENQYDIIKYLVNNESVFETADFKSGDSIFHPGNPTNGVYYIVSGMVDVFKKRDSGGEDLIRSIAPHNLIGEVNLILDQPWDLIVRARDHVKALFVSSEKFKELYETRPELKAIVDTLKHVYQSPTRGEVTQYFGRFLHMSAIISKFKLKENREIVSSQVVGKNIQSISVTNVNNPQSYTYEGKKIYRELQLFDGKLVGVTSYGEWLALQDLYSMVFENKEISQTELQQFIKQGEITLPEKGPAQKENDDEVICNCMYVTRGVISGCIKCGRTTIPELQEELAVGTVCGGCLPTIQGMLGHESWQAMHILSVENLTPDVKAYRLIPVRNKPLRQFHAGQHVVIQCEIDGNWIERSYTLTSSPGNLDHYEIAIKREDKGLLSRWLFENDQRTPFLRVSHPTGDFKLDTTKAQALVCFTAGIGITPAVSFARTIAENKMPRLLSIYLTARNEKSCVYDSELELLSTKQSQIKYYKHLTEAKGRLTPEDIIKIASLDLNADYFICGPKGFESMVKTALQSAGIKNNQIIIEQFTHANQL